MTDAIEMRPALRISPKVMRMVRRLQTDPAFVAFVCQGDPCPLSCDAVAMIVVSGLMQVWATARSVARDGHFEGACVQDLDQVAGVPSFGEAMVLAGWARQDIGGVTLPNFREHNPTGVKLRREPAEAPASPEGFDEFWEAYPRKVGKGEALKAWKKLKLGKAMLPRLLEAVRTQKRSRDWLKDKGAYIPHPSTWLNQTRWEDVVEGVIPEAKDWEQKKHEEVLRQRRLNEEARAKALAGDDIRAMLDKMKLRRRREAEDFN